MHEKTISEILKLYKKLLTIEFFKFVFKNENNNLKSQQDIINFC